MRYPIYFFLLVSGFFYLTGKPVDDRSPRTVADSGQALLPYARNIAKRSGVEETSVKPLKIAKTVVEPLKSVANKPVKSGTEKVRQASLESHNEVTGNSWKTNVKISKKDADSGAVIAPDMANKPSFDSQPQNSLKKADRKKLDWTVFGNSRKVVTASLPQRVPSKDQLDAAGLASDTIISQRKLRKRRVVSRARATRKKQRRIRQRARNARKYRAVRKKSRKYARLNKRNRNIRRIASRRTVRKPRKKRYASRRTRKKFGFGAVNGVISFSTGN